MKNKLSKMFLLLILIGVSSIFLLSGTVKNLFQRGCILSDRAIRDEIKKGNIVLHNPDSDAHANIQNCSVDFTLGKYFFRMAPKGITNPWDKNSSCQYWGNSVDAMGNIKYNFQQASEVSSTEESERVRLPIGSEYIELGPLETILGHTQEFIGGKKNITTIMKARSSLGRSNITVCRDAGFGDIGYVNRWTLEITNNGKVPVVLPVGARIGQIAFFYTTEPDTSYKGKYQDSGDVEKNWSPSMLCPRLWEDVGKKY